MEQYKQEMGARLKQARREKDLTQEKFSEMLGISQKHYSEVERGLAGLSVKTLIEISDILEISLDYLLKGREFLSLPSQFQTNTQLNELFYSSSPYTQQQILRIVKAAREIEQYAAKSN
jgi:transcriptional regulator with XRE-family HTH domain